MGNIDDNKTTTYVNSDKNKTETYGNSENQKTSAYNDIQNKEFKSRTHGIGVGDKLTLKKTDYTITEIISEGTGEAVIYKVKNSNNQIFALKLYFEFRDVKEEPNFETLKRIKEINDPDILKLHDFGVGADKYQGKYCYEISDFAEGGDLFAVANFNEKYTKDFIEKIIVPEILNGIRKLHDFKIYHCDLKPSNIFYRDLKQTDLIIGDYGSAKAYDLEVMKELHKTTPKGTDKYLAPEQARGIISEKNDYYSIGMTLLQLLYPEQLVVENRFQQIDNIKFDKIVERQYNSQPVVDFNPLYKRLNNLIEGLTLINHINRFGRNEVEKWLKREEVEVKYKATESGSVYAIKLGYATIKTDKDFIQVLESQPNWYEDLIEPIDDKENRESNLTLWLDSYRDMSERKVIVAMIKFYQGLGKEYVKESLLRYFDPEREIRIDMHSFNFFASDNLKKDVEACISKLDEIWKITSFEKIRLHLFQLEFSLKQLALIIVGENLILVNSLIEKISSAFGCIPESFASRKTQLQKIFTIKNEEESYNILLNLFYSFDKERTYRDTLNRSFENIQDIALSYSIDEELFHNKFCKSELIVFLSLKKRTDIKYNNLEEFLFFVFCDYYKSDIHVENVVFKENKAIITYNFNKSLTEFLSTKGISKTVLVKVDHRRIEIKTKSIPSGKNLYRKFLTEIYMIYSVSEESFERNSLKTAKTAIKKHTRTFIKSNSKFVNRFVFLLLTFVLIIGVIILLFKTQSNSETTSPILESSVKYFYIVTAEVANVRSEPSVESQIIGQAKKNDRFEVNNINLSEWTEIKYKDRTAYIHSSLIKNESEFTKRVKIINKDSKIIDNTQVEEEKEEQIIPTIEYPDGSKYIGLIVNGNKEGKAVYYFPNGNRFEGNFENNLKQGKGVLYFKDGSRAEGVWVDDLREGEFIFYSSTGNAEKQLFLNGARIN